VYTGESFERPVPGDRGDRPRLSPARRAAVGLALASGLWLLALAASQATSATVAVPFLERTIGALGDVPALLQMHEPMIRATASLPGSEDAAVPGFPVQGVALPRILAQQGTREDWRAALLHDSALATYERGPAVFAPGGVATTSGIFSTSLWVRLVMRLTSSETHRAAWLLAWALGIATLALAAVLLAVTEGPRRFVAAGLALVGGAMLAAVIGLLGLLVAMLLSMGSGSAFVGEVGGLIRTVAWAPVHDAARLGIAGIAIAVPAAVVAAWLARAEDDDAPEERSPR